jgi:hypothetical protein
MRPKGRRLALLTACVGVVDVGTVTVQTEPK